MSTIQVDLFGNSSLVATKKASKSAVIPEKLKSISGNLPARTFNPERVSCQAISINPSYIAAFTYVPNMVLSAKQRTISALNLRDNKKKVDISKKAQKGLYAKCAMFMYSARKKIHEKKGGIRCDTVIKMITLTLSSNQRHSDVWIKDNMLDKFIDWLSYRYGIRNYIWKAERQMKQTGNIHFHILVNRYICYKEIQNKWNLIQAKYGYIQPFFNQYGHSDPHSTEIRNGKKAKNLCGYISKYICKKPDGANYVMVEGKTWFCSKSLQGLGNVVLNEMDSQKWMKYFDGLLSTFSNVEIKSLDKCKLFFFNFMQFINDKNFNYFDTVLTRHILKLETCN